MSNSPAPTAPIEPRPWDKGIAPRYIALFVSIVYLDPLAARTLAVGGLLPSVFGALAAAGFCYLLLFRPMALWGVRARRPLHELGASTFGSRGAVWVPGVLMGLGQVVWFAVTIYVVIDVSFRSLASAGLMDPKHLEPLAGRGFKPVGPLFLFVAVNWTICSAVLGTLAMRLVAAVMYAYPIFPGLVLAGVLLWAIPNAGAFVPLGFDPVTTEPIREPASYAFLMMIQLIVGFFATQGALAADWGAASRDERDVRLGGWVGVAFAASILATVALLIVAGYVARLEASTPLPAEMAAQVDYQRALILRHDKSATLDATRRAVQAVGGGNFTIRSALQYGIGGRLGLVLLMAFGVGLLGPSCFTPSIFSQRFATAWPRLPRLAWALIGAVASWPLIALGVPARLDLIFGAMGAVFAPIVGSMAAESSRHRGGWPGPRRGWNGAGFMAWLLGLMVGLLPWIGPALRLGDWSRTQPAAVFAFLAAFLGYRLCAAVGLEPPVLESALTERATGE